MYFVDSVNQEAEFLPTDPSDYRINKDKTTHDDYCGRKGDNWEQEYDTCTHKQTTKDNIQKDRGAAASVEAACCSGSTIAVHTNGHSQNDHYSTLGHHKTLPYIDECEGDTYHHLKQQTNTGQPSADECDYNALGSTDTRSMPLVISNVYDHL